MNISAVIAQIKQFCPIFNNNVAGAASYAEGLETTVSLQMPACFVYPLEDTIEQTSGMGGSMRQVVRESVAIVLQLDNSADRRGQAAVSSVHIHKFAVFSALLNWNPGLPTGRSAQGMIYDGGHLLGFDRARLFWQLEMSIAINLTQDDGYIPPAADLQSVVFENIGYQPVQIDIPIQIEIDAVASFALSASAH